MTKSKVNLSQSFSNSVCWLILAIFINRVFPAISIAAPEPIPITERTTNRNQANISKNLLSSAISLSIDGKGAHFVTRHDGAKFYLGDPKQDARNPKLDFDFDFILTKPGEMFWQPDHHGHIIYTLKKIGLHSFSSNSIILHYESKFYMGSFGKDIILIDEGDITLTGFRHW